ncbi:hypothetical protein EP073_05585 [Geovibrio thiophilus]|uniref:Uncharacterized protein n=1 Tax=Geovibrio thiophilus TaxID=139438 RepID=A0A410JXK6_9BACT|nr:hypothetical protein [Geovibrio thiophilus]QAR32894.1 hypothetical protein EP073_05585 [Geovibrio thiophilus]
MRFGRTALIILTVFSTFSVINAETFEEYMKSQMDEFQQFKDERDKEFTAFLKEMWIRVETEEPIKQIDEPKPIKMPVAPPHVEKAPVPVVKPTPPKPIVVPEPAKPTPPAPPAPVVPAKPEPPVVKPEPKPDAPIAKPEPAPQPYVAVVPQPVPVPVPAPVVAAPPAIKGRPLEFVFFGSAIKVGYDTKLQLGAEAPLNGKKLGEFWEKAALSDYEPLMNNLLKYRKELKMTDWGFILLVSETAGKIAADRNGKVLLTWFILSKAGYETRTAYDKDSVYLLVPASTKLYGVSFFTLDDKRYYAVSADGFINNLGSVYTYEKSYPKADRSMDFRMADYPDLGRKVSERDLSFSYGGQTFNIKVPYNMNDIIYLKYHPQTDVNLYAEAGLPDWAGKPLLTQLAPIIKGKTDEEAVNILLKFVQTAFKYATDDQQFGREKFLFAMETIYYPYSDCEDRSILFTYLVKNLLNLDAVFLDYPGHIAAAVAFKTNVKGDSVTFEGKRYTVTDPTYINATIGMTMPQFAKNVPKVVKF